MVTGIAGFAGNYLSELLLKQGIEVYGASEEVEFKPFLPIDAAAIHYQSIDIRDRARLEDYLRSIRPEMVFHLAAKSSPSQSKQFPEDTFEVNFGGTVALLEAIRRSGVRCRFLLVSSSHVYGRADASVISKGRGVAEDAPPRPETPYAASKAAAEMAAYQYWKSYGIETIIARAFNHTGPGQGEGFVGPDLARKIIEIERGIRPPELEVAGFDREIDFSDVRDVVRGYYSTLVTGAPGEAFNLCSGRGITVRAIAEGLAARSSTRISMRSAASETETGRRSGLIGDNSKAARVLGWSPRIPISETLLELAEYWRQKQARPEQPTGRGAH